MVDIPYNRYKHKDVKLDIEVFKTLINVKKYE